MSLIPSYDKIGQLRTSPVPPSSNPSDHPPVDLAQAFFNGTLGTGAGTLMGAPGAGLRYRIFYAKVVQYAGGTGGFQLVAGQPGGALIVLTGYNAGGAPIPYVDYFNAPLSGWALVANTSVQISAVTGGGSSAIAMCVYTVENV